MTIPTRRLAVAVAAATVWLGGIAIPPASAAAGDLDGMFGAGGTVTTAASAPNTDADGFAAAIQPDGKVVVAGAETPVGSDVSNVAVYRYTPEGALDTGFGAGGRVVLDLRGGDDYATAVAIQPDGKVVVAGADNGGTGGYDFAVVRFNPDGSLDPGFGSGGKVFTDFGSRVDDDANALALDPSGNIMVVGDTGASPSSQIAAVRYTPSGTIDPAFNGGAPLVVTRYIYSEGHAVLPQDGKWLVGGALGSASSPHGTLVRLNGDGSVDTSFGVGGDTGYPGQEGIDSVALTGQGGVTKILALGTAVQADGSRDFAVDMFQAGGGPDSGFGRHGVATVDFGSTLDVGTAMAVTRDGKVLVAGLTDTGGTRTDFAVARLTATGALDPGFSQDGKAVTSFGVDAAANGMVLQPDGKAVLAGFASTASGDSFALARYDGTKTAQGYWLTASDGGIFSYGLPFYGSAGAMTLNQPIVGMAATTIGKGYWLVARDGGVFAYGNAAFSGSTGATRLNSPIVGMATDPDGTGYWLVAADGGVFAFDAPFEGSAGDVRVNQPIVGMAPTSTGLGYWLVARDGGIFAYGDAAFSGSTGAMKLNQPIVGMAADPDGQGYWLVAADGGIFAFDATFSGSTGFMRLNSPIVGMAADPDGQGYWLTAADGGVFAFDAPFFGSAGALPLNHPVVGMMRA